MGGKHLINKNKNMKMLNLAHQYANYDKYSGLKILALWILAIVLSGLNF